MSKSNRKCGLSSPDVDLLVYNLTDLRYDFGDHLGGSLYLDSTRTTGWRSHYSRGHRTNARKP